MTMRVKGIRGTQSTLASASTSFLIEGAAIATKLLKDPTLNLL